ncbi:glutathione S-transferase [Xylariaceae sp. FL0804]|nr:glutathione S-transferase [Xylariaceae sp. FL0804]
MAPFGKIYTYPNNFRAHRAQILGKLGGLEVVEAEGFQMGVTNTSPEFRAKFPMGKVPTFEGADGYCVSDNVAISTYVARSGNKAAQLLGAEPKANAKIVEWVTFAENELIANIMPPLYMLYVAKFYPSDPAKYETCVKNADRALKVLEGALSGGKKYLVGDQLTMADVMVVSVLHSAVKHLVDAAWRKELPNTVAYLDGVIASDEAFKVMGDVEKCEKRCGPE